MLPVGDSCIVLFQKKVGELYSFLRPNSKPTVTYTWHDMLDGCAGLAAWDWHPFSGAGSSACLTMWQAISVLAWKETTNYLLGSFFAGLAGWVSSSCGQTHGGGEESHGEDNKALASGSRGCWDGSPASLPVPSERDVSVPKELEWYLTSVNISYEGLEMSLQMNCLHHLGWLWAVTCYPRYLLDAAHCMLSNGHNLQHEIHKMKPWCFICGVTAE